MRMSLQSHRWALNVFRQYSDLSWPQGSRVPSQQGLFSSTLLRGAGIMQHSPQSWTSEHYLKYRKTQCLLQIPQRLGLLACWNWWKYQVHITDRGFRWWSKEDSVWAVELLCIYIIRKEMKLLRQFYMGLALSRRLVCEALTTTTLLPLASFSYF